MGSLKFNMCIVVLNGKPEHILYSFVWYDILNFKHHAGWNNKVYKAAHSLGTTFSSTMGNVSFSRL